MMVSRARGEFLHYGPDLGAGLTLEVTLLPEWPTRRNGQIPAASHPLVR